MESPILKTKTLSKYYGSGHTEVKAVNNVSLDVMPGEIVLIMGPSGSGKTTLLSMLGGLLRPTRGSIEIDDNDITLLDESRLPEIRALKIGFIFQAFNLLDALNVEENILFPSQLRQGGIPRARHRANNLIEQLGLEHRRRALPKKLSGGEKQRVAIARALINEPKLILADEPTGNLDSQTGQEVIMILHDIARDDGCSVVLVTHDPRVEDIAGWKTAPCKTAEPRNMAGCAIPCAECVSMNGPLNFSANIRTGVMPFVRNAARSVLTRIRIPIEINGPL